MDQEQNQANVSPKQQVAEKIREATNVLVTVRSNPSVDELASAIGLTLMLNKLGKHGTAVFSGQIPSTLEFLKPEETIETNTDSLRDFIVSLDKAKADKLRYKVEENVVKIFITPYRTSISQEDLEFTQGDFNVDVVLALGVTQREELDQAIMAHGRILHDATVVTVTAGQKESDLGNINWQDSAASSLSEMLVSISEALQGGLIDAQIATAFLTGIVAGTERFSNTKTSPKVMTMSAQLMAAGANQQLIANELEKAETLPPAPAPAPELTNSAPGEVADEKDSIVNEDGSLEITHTEEPVNPAETAPKPEEQPVEQPLAPDSKADSSELPKIERHGHAISGVKETSSEEEQKNDDNSFLPSGSSEDEDDNSRGENPFIVGQPQEKPDAQDDSIELPSVQDTVSATTTDVRKDDIHIDNDGNITKPNVVPKHKNIEPLPKQGGTQQLSDETPPALAEPAVNQALTEQEQATEPVIPPTNDQIANTLPPPPAMSKDEAPNELKDDTTLEQIEQTVHSPHLEQTQQPTENVDNARSAVDSAINQSDFNPAGHARQNIGAMPLGGQLHSEENQQEQESQPPSPVFNQPGSQQSNDEAPPPVPPPFTGQ